MFTVNLLDGSKKTFSKSLSVIDVAVSINSKLKKKALAAIVDGKEVDISYIIDKDCNLVIITSEHERSLDIIRHSSAHLLAQAVKRLYNKVQITIGPVIKDGFYYDFFYKDGFSTDDLKKIEKEMHKIVKESHPISRSNLSRDAAIDFFKKQGELYKADIIASIPQNETISLYKQGDFIDLCRGPHVINTNKLKIFKLTKVAGAYWRGDSNNEMLQRIYGTAWHTREELDNYLYKLSEAKKRDHRVIGKHQNLFHIQEEAPGMVFWHAKGWMLYKEVMRYMAKIFKNNGYQEIHTPQIIDKSLWQASGHWDKFSSAMFTTSSENKDYAIKPMNCPAHIQVYKKGLTSYKELPIRLAEFGSCHRNEASGTLHGLMRVRNFTQDDGHIFCEEKQIQKEVSNFIDLTYKVYHHFGFENIEIKLSTRPDNRVGNDILWDKAELALKKALDTKKINWTLQEGEGAFYGPKIDFILKDCLDRAWQCGTLQVDFSMPKRLNATYITKNNSKKTPVMLHRAIIGSIERFIGILIEHYSGSLPFWLAPIQVMLINISKKQEDYTLYVANKLKKHNIRVSYDLQNEKIGFKIRKHSMQRYPYIIVIGAKEEENDTISVRKRGDYDLGIISVEDFVKKMAK